MRLGSLDPIIVASWLIARDPTQLSCQAVQPKSTPWQGVFPDGWRTWITKNRKITIFPCFVRSSNILVGTSCLARIAQSISTRCPLKKPADFSSGRLQEVVERKKIEAERQ